MSANPYPRVVKECIHDGHNEQCQKRRCNEPADDCPGQRRPHLRACADSQSEGQHTEYHCECSHHNRAKPRATRCNDGLPALNPLGAQDLCIIYKEYGIFRHEPHEHDKPDEGHHIDRIAGEGKHGGHSHQRQGAGKA